MAGYSYMDVTIARPSSECLLSSTQPLGTADASILLSSTQPIPKARCLVPLTGRKSFTPVLGGCAQPQTPLKEWSATSVLARIPGSKSKTRRSRTSLSRTRSKAQLFYTAPADIADWTPVSGGSGVIDCWPLRAPGSHTPGRQPKLLENLQRFREQELARIDKSGAMASDDKLQVSRECLDSISRNFKTYQPMLCEIKADYERALEEQAQVARTVPHLESKLSSLQSEHQTMMLRMEREHTSQAGAKDQALTRAKQKVLQLEVAVEHAKNYREEASRKMADIDDQLGHLQITLSFQAKNALHANAVNQTTQAELRDAHSQVSQLQKSQTLLKREIRNMVPASKLQASEMARLTAENKLHSASERIAALEASNKGLQQAYDTISSEHGAIKEMYMHLVGSLELPNELNSSSSVLTPRPDWKQLESSVDGKLSGSSEQRVRQMSSMLEEAQNQLAFFKLQVDCRSPFWQPMVKLSAGVPPLLVHSQPVRNLHLSMEQVEQRVAELWSSKIAEEDELLKALPMAEYIQTSFNKKNVPASGRAELMYNLYHGLAYWGGASPELHLFRKVLEGKTNETVYFAAGNVVSKVATTSAHLRDAADREVLSTADVANAIHIECPVKSRVDAEVLGYVLEAGVAVIGGWEELLPTHLTGADPEPSINQWTSMLRAQAIKERSEHLTKLTAALEAAAFGAFVGDCQKHAEETKRLIEAKLAEYEELERAALFGTGDRPATPMAAGDAAVNTEAIEAIKGELAAAEERAVRLATAKVGSELLGVPVGGWGCAQVSRDEFQDQLTALDPDISPIDTKELTRRLYGEEGLVVHLSQALTALEAGPLHRHSMPAMTRSSSGF